MLPNVSMLVADKYNSDGTLKSIKHTNSSLLITNFGAYTSSGYMIFQNGSIFKPDVYSSFFFQDETPTLTENKYEYWWCPKDNKWYGHTNTQTSWLERDIIIVGEYGKTSSAFTSFDIRQPVKLATTEMLDKVQNQVDTNTSAIATKQDTLVSGTNIKTINSTTVLGSGNFALANQSLSNLDSTGQMVVDSQNGTISNCITEIPQDLKFELNNGTLTLKAGSIITLPNGTQKQTTQDNSITVTQNDTWVAFPRDNGFALNYVRLNRIGSGSTLPADGTNYQCFFNSTDGLIYLWNNNAWGVWNSALPACIFTVTNGAISSIDQVFNGTGYIGHHAFCLPNVKALIPDGKNADGTLKSINITNSSLRITEMTSSDSGEYKRYLDIMSNGTFSKVSYKEVNNYNELSQQSSHLQAYAKKENVIIDQYDMSKSSIVPFIRYKLSGTTVTQFDIRQPVSMATVEMLNNLLTSITGYNASATQTLKNINGVLTWVTD